MASAAKAQEPMFHGLYVLSFNRWGNLVDPFEVELAVQEMRAHLGIKRILVISYGWANDGEVSYSTYRHLLDDFSKESALDLRETAVIAVGWDSSQTGFRKLLNDVIPLPIIADSLAFIPDQLLFPISFWSKAAMADRIGFGGLRSALNVIFSSVYPDVEKSPPVYLIGHSFGTRVLSGLMQNRLGPFPVKAEPFAGASRVSAALMIQPALARPSLHNDAEYPILVTQSAHDHANGFLFPVANIPLNAFSFTLFEAFFRRYVFSYVESGVGTAVDTTMSTMEVTADMMKDIMQAPLPERMRPMDPNSNVRIPRPHMSLPGDTGFRLRRSLAEVLSIPASLAFTIVSTPISYAYTQTRGLATHPVDHVMDTLAQIPLVEIPVEALSRVAGKEVPWGRRSKGFFNLGVLHESVGRVVTHGILERDVPPVFSMEEFQRSLADGCHLPICSGAFAVDASDEIQEGIFFENLARPMVDFTLGWLDPIGAHADYLNSDVVGLMEPLYRNGEADLQPVSSR